MRAPRKALFFALLILMPAFAGCDVKDWYNQNGTVRIQMDVQPAAGTSLDSFRLVKAAIFGVNLKQSGDIDQKDFTFGTDPKIVDLVQHGRSGEPIALTQFTTNLRATERVAIRMAVFEVIDAAGNSMEVCHEADTPEHFPCFYQPDNNAVFFETGGEKSFAPPRGGLVVVHFPVAIKYEQRGRVAEYFLFADPAQVILENHR